MQTNLDRVLIEMSDALVRKAQQNLGTRKIGKNNNYGVASGELKRSLTYTINVKGAVTTYNFGARGRASKYARFVHDGVNGTERNVGSPYTFRKQPPSSAILSWMRKKNVKLRDKNGRFKAKTKSAMNSAAFLIARSIKRKGVKGVKYYTEAKTAIVKRYEPKIAEAIAQDISKNFQ